MAGNKFWGGDSESASSDSSSDSEEAPKIDQGPQGGRRQMTRWAEESSSDDEPERRRVVRTAADKRFDLIREKIKEMKNHMKIDDFPNLLSDYEALQKMLEKMKAIIEQEGGPPAVFIKAVTKLEVYIEELQEAHKQEGAAKLSASKQKGFNTLRAKVRKGNKEHQDRIQQCKDHPSDFESEGENKNEDDDDSGSDSGGDDSSGSDSNSDSSSSSSSSSGSDSDSDSDSDSNSSSNSSSSSAKSGEENSYHTGSNSDTDEDMDEDAVREKKMLRWVITDEKAAKEKAAREKAALQSAQGGQTKSKKTKGDVEKTPKKNRQAGGDGAGFPSGQDEKQEFSPEELKKKITEISQSRGRKGFERQVYLKKLQDLMPHAVKQGPRAELYILSSMASVDFDQTGGAFAPMKLETWNQAIEKVIDMVPKLAAYHKELVEDGVDPDTHTIEGDAEDPRAYPIQQDLFVAHVEKLDDELYKALQFTVDVYGSEYNEILGNSSKFVILLRRVIKFFESIKENEHLGMLAMRMLEHLHFKPDMLNEKVFEAIRHQVSEDEKDLWIWPKDSSVYIEQLCRHVQKMNNRPDLVRRASFCQVYHLALHGHFQKARDLLHLGNLNELAETQGDVRTQILNNRCTAQMGLCAFRAGKIPEAHQCLMTVCQHNKARELLSQGMSFSKTVEKTPEQEQQERLRQLPYHMHINLEVLDSAHQICAMLLEVPNIAMHSIDPGNKQRIISRVLRRNLDAHDKQLYICPPETPKEAVVCAAKALQRGDWQNAFAALENLKIWDHIDPGSPTTGAEIKEMVKERIKAEALRTYLFAYASIYDAFHLDQLVGMFDLPQKTVHSIVSKMMYENQLAAFWDESSKYVLVQHSEPSHLQRLALTLADRGAQAVENNERLVDQRGGGSAFKDDRGRQLGNQGSWDSRGNQGRRGFGGKAGAQKGQGKGKGKGTSGGFGNTSQRTYRGWENARAGALRGNVQRGWATPARS